ncbi:hypothetical protein M514_00601 [Trichuris suis]|uniref:Uncharacterized protein n=1 Tax=Trichuris suis TaxID=68888 RepID=A0A085MMC9_9BILA|nr:hypothetical protein M513_00601 [Trichuris suis]KFD60209.1 hypothetical protein M514_00601 [Trichuris suis]
MVDSGCSPFSASSYSVLSPLAMNEVIKDQRLNKSKDIVLACGPSYSPLQDITDIQEYLALNFGNSSSTKTNEEDDEEERSISVPSSLRLTASSESIVGENMKSTSHTSLQEILENCASATVQLAAKKEIEPAVEFFANAFCGKESLSIQDLSALLQLFDRRIVLSIQGAMDLADIGYKHGRIKKEDQLRLKAALTGGPKKCQSCTLHKFMLLTKQSLSSLSGMF